MRKANRSGFTLVEIVAALLIMGIVAAVVIAKSMDMGTISLNSQAEVVKSHIRYAQARAMNTNEVWGINFSGSEYSLFRNGNTADIVTIPGQENNTVALSGGAHFSSGGIISFDTWGRPYTDAAGTVAQGGSRVISLALDSYSKDITITQRTGFIP